MWTESTRPKCFRCDGPGFTYIDGKFWCMDCLKHFMDKLNKAKEKILLEEDE